LGTKTD
jgi:hypothetical protein